MTEFRAIYRWFRAEPIRWHLIVLALLGSLCAAYVAATYVMMPNGYDDFIYRGTGVPRKSQILWCAIVLSAIAGFILLAHIRRKGSLIGFGAAGRRWIIIVTILLFLNAVTMSLGAVLNDVAERFWLPLYGWVAIVLSVETLLLAFVLVRLHTPRLHTLLVVALSAFNFYALDLTLMGWLQRRDMEIRIAVGVLVALGLLVLFSALGQAVVRPTRVAFVLALTALAPLVALPSSLGTSERPEQLSAFKDIAFRATPNIHIYSVDALTPPLLVREFIGLAEVPYEQAIRETGGIRLPNAFASQVPTRWSLNSVMRLANPAFPPEGGYFAGRAESPLGTLLQANGYHVVTGFENMYLGSKGPYIDDFTPEPSRSIHNSTLCGLTNAGVVTFFGFCRIGAALGGPEPQTDWPAQVLAMIQEVAGSDQQQPTFTFHHLLNPIGHTALDFQSLNPEHLASYARIYETRARKTAELTRRLGEIIRASKVPTVAIVMGDHGMYVSRTVSYEDDPTFFVQDQHGITLAVWLNGVDCDIAQLRHYSGQYATPERLLGGLFRCLASDTASVDRALTFDEAFPFVNFLYE